MFPQGLEEEEMLAEHILTQSAFKVIIIGPLHNHREYWYILPHMNSSFLVLPHEKEGIEMVVVLVVLCCLANPNWNAVKNMRSGSTLLCCRLACIHSRSQGGSKQAAERC